MASPELEAAGRVQQAFRSKGLRLALAESCTGGYVASLITSHPGASGFFEASFVTYSKAAKQTALGLACETVRRHGTISPEAALEMARGAAMAVHAVAGLAITGNLGPAAHEGKDIGLIYAAVSLRGRAETREFRFTGDRQEIKQQAALAALEFLLEAVTTWG